MTAIYTLWKAVFFVDFSSLVVSISDREAMQFHEIVLRAYDNLPDWMRGESIAKNQHELKLETGGSITCLTPAAGRGAAKGLLIIDEAAFIPHMEEFWARVFPTISTGGKVIAISTVNGIGNWYHQTWLDAESKVNKFNPIRLHYTEHPDYQNEQWVEEMKAQLGDKRWQQEVIGEFLGSANTYVPGECIKKLSEKIEEPIKTKLEDELRIWKDPEPGEMYVIGCDGSEGLGDEETDYSCAQVVNISTLEQVAEFYSKNYPPAKFAQVIASLGKTYNMATVVVEKNNPGVAILSDLYHHINYENIFIQKENLEKVSKGRMGFAQGKITRAQVQASLYHNFTHYISQINSLRLVNELWTWIFNPRTQRADHMKNCHDDAIISFGIALVAREEIIRNSSPYFNLGGIKLDSNTEMKSTYIEDGTLIKEIIGEELGYEDNDTLIPDLSISRPQDDLLKEFGW